MRLLRMSSARTCIWLAGALLVASCGGGGREAGGESPSQLVDSSGAPRSESAEDGAPAGEVDPAGVLRVGKNLVSGIGVHFDPVHMASEQPNIEFMELIYGTLLRQAPDGSLEPWMAEDYEVIDPQTVRISLRPDVVFTDGSSYDAEAVRTSMMRTRFESADEAIAARLDAGIEALENVEVIDPLTVEAQLSSPVASVFVDSLASLAGVVVSPKQIEEDPASIDLSPIGAGPYTFDRYDTDQRVVLTKNPDFWDVENWRIGGFEFVHTPLGPPQANGLLSDTVDLVRNMPASTVEAVETDSDLSTDLIPVQYATLLLCAEKPPFDNPEFRRAVQIGIDRQAYLDLLYGGEGSVAYGFHSEGDASFDSAWKDQLAYDPDHARELVEKSGADPTFDLVTITSHNWSRNAEIIQAQLEQIGITVNIVVQDDVYSSWIEPQAPGALIAYVPGVRTGGYTSYVNQLSEGGSQAYCGGEGNAAAMEHADNAVELSSDDPQAITEFRLANQAFIDDANHISLAFAPFGVTWNTTRVGYDGDEMTFIDYQGDPRPHYEAMYVKK